MVKIVISRSFAPNITFKKELIVQKPKLEIGISKPIKIQVGIEKCLHIEIDFPKSQYYIGDVLIGNITFFLISLKIKHMDLILEKKESIGIGPNTYCETEKLAEFEIMDGVPVKGEIIPIRFFLKLDSLTPTNIENPTSFTLKYYINIVLFDEEDRRYFKLNEIELFDKK